MDAPFTSDEDDSAARRIADVALVRSLLIEAARRGEAVSYSQALADLGTRFTRPKMRALCRTLDRIDEAGAAAGEPELAVLVVRESDGLPGQAGGSGAARRWAMRGAGPARRRWRWSGGCSAKHSAIGRDVPSSVMPDLFRHPPGGRSRGRGCAARWTPEQVRGDG
jgi:hypothetical protein